MEQRPKVLIIGAGSRGTAYAQAVQRSGLGVVTAIAEPITFKRNLLASKVGVWSADRPEGPGQAFSSYMDFVDYERQRRLRASRGEATGPGVDAAFVCVLDEQHAAVIEALSEFELHLLSEKPLATTLEDCMKIYACLQPDGPASPQTSVFSIGHVLRYSPHNTILRKLLLEERAIGDLLSIEHTEPVGWWHFSHSYVRGNWRKQATTAPSLLTKSCHDIDLLLWLLTDSLSSSSAVAAQASPRAQGQRRRVEPTSITSTGHLSYFRRSRKPRAAKDATNCLSCPIEQDCKYSARKIYLERQLHQNNADWPVKIVNPEIEDCLTSLGMDRASEKLLQTLSEDYDTHTPQIDVESRPWFGRCVWESDNDVCDDQHVLLEWDGAGDGNPRTASFHMIAHTQAQCERRGIVYGTDGEIQYDSRRIRVIDFASGGAHKDYYPKQMPGGHGGGDDGLVVQFLKAVNAVMRGSSTVQQAQDEFIGCTLEDAIRSHAVGFAAEEARVQRKVVDWRRWWDDNVSELVLLTGSHSSGVSADDAESSGVSTASSVASASKQTSVA